MPLPFISTTSDNSTRGQKFSRWSGPIYSGGLADNTATGPTVGPGAVAVIQSTASAVTQLVTTTGQTAKSSFVYITQGTLAVSSSTNANIAASPPYTGQGAALYFDTTRMKLSIYSTEIGDWVSVTLSSS